MKVLIVAKTRQGSAACVGGINAEGCSVRLIAHDAGSNEHVGMHYEVGDVWDLITTPPDSVIPPHIENVIVQAGRRIGRVDDPTRAIWRFMPPVCGDPLGLYEGLVQTSDSSALFVARRTGVPRFSTGFWQPDRPLQRVEAGKRIRYCYAGPAGPATLVFVGFQEPPSEIEAGALVRVSLAHWWRSPDHPDDELRCYVQISGWFAASSGGREAMLAPQRRPAWPSDQTVHPQADMVAARASD